MKYKILLAGKDYSLIHEFFMQLGDSFECLTTSTVYEDISNHLKYFKPDMFILCMKYETGNTYHIISSIKHEMRNNNCPITIIGEANECYEFKRSAGNAADLILEKPMHISTISEKIIERLRENKMLADAVSAANQALDPTDALNYVNELMEPKRKHILVIDDDVRMLKMVKGLLSPKYDVATAANGHTALKFLQTKKTDLILLDYVMPEEDGPAVFAKLRANVDTCDIPIVFLTGITERNKIEQVLVMKPQGYLLKPINRVKLFETIKKIIG